MIRVGSVLVAVTLAVSACAADEPFQEGIEARSPLVGEAPAGADAAVYFELDVGAADVLVGAESPVADTVSLHTMELLDGGGFMFETDAVALPADATTRFAPLGNHVMLEGLGAELMADDTVPVTLRFDRHPPISLTVEIVPLEQLAELEPGTAP